MSGAEAIIGLVAGIISAGTGVAQVYQTKQQKTDKVVAMRQHFAAGPPASGSKEGHNPNFNRWGSNIGTGGNYEAALEMILQQQMHEIDTLCQ
ncbi:hypothetical protein PILCRDRAFT_813344 [Piloderma croceum F 1598]|uniref:Uncharacterized protein n=1 Tax=Piloderma croceum (strain F 1598) TaxID=765440 RepID=A0A0C3GFI9_PILCF|nr:hypothetical protein PILCRDRAFT_813344 [Piloderma croceum F 1598]